MRWDSSSLYLKSKLYLQRANSFDHERVEFPLWSALGLELLARAALTRVHPALNADARDSENLLFAFGFEGTQTPRSLPLHSVLLRLERIVPNFGKTQREMCDFLTILRNEELHGAAIPFAALPESRWLPRFYEASQILCTFLGKDLADWLGADLAPSAERLIAALKSETLKMTRDKVSIHRKAFEARSVPERAKLSEAATIKATFLPAGLSAIACPACASKALLSGELIREMEPRYEDDTLLIDQEYLAVRLRCPACGLELHKLEEVLSAGLEPRFTGQRATSLHELFEHESGDDYENM